MSIVVFIDFALCWDGQSLFCFLYLYSVYHTCIHLCPLRYCILLNKNLQVHDNPLLCIFVVSGVYNCNLCIVGFISASFVLHAFISASCKLHHIGSSKSNTSARLHEFFISERMLLSIKQGTLRRLKGRFPGFERVWA